MSEGGGDGGSGWFVKLFPNKCLENEVMIVGYSRRDYVFLLHGKSIIRSSYVCSGTIAGGALDHADSYMLK